MRVPDRVIPLVDEVEVALEADQYGLKDNYLYHYSLEKYECLLTLEEQWNRKIKVPTKEDLDYNTQRKVFRYDEFPYSQHLSFLLDPLPVDIIAKFKGGNNKLYNAKSCWEYKIDIAAFKDNINYYMLAENDVNNFFAYNLWLDVEFPGKHFMYFKTRDLINKLAGNIGYDYLSLRSAVFKYKGRTREAFKELTESDEFEWVKTKGMYAPTVPHLMAYPKIGVIEYADVKKIKLL
jgi:hypothetical protein